MAIEIRTAKSAEMAKNAAMVGRMTSGVSFSEESKTANWKLLRFICNAGYTLMPKEKGVKRERFCLDSVSAEMSIPKNPEISPIYFDRFSEFPPTFITVDDRETLRADADALYEKLDKAGVPVTMVRMKNSFHAFAPIGTSAPETMALLIDNVRFMKSVWGEEAY